MEKNLKVLVVEDTEDHLCFVIDLLKDRFNNDVEVFSSSYKDDALEILRLHPEIDYIIIDLSITKSKNKRSLGYAGLDLMKEIRETKRRIHIILHTIATKEEIGIDLEMWDCYYEHKRGDMSSTLADKIAYLASLNNTQNG